MKDKLHYRTISIRKRDGTPATFNKEDRSVEVVIATENPVPVWGIDEVLLMDGAVIPKNKRMPLLDAHNRWSVKGIVGSIKNLHRSNGELVGTAVFSRIQDADDAMTLVEEGHLTDISVGYRVGKYEDVADRETKKIKGKEYKGPVRIVTKWYPKEASVAPIGADENSKVRTKDIDNLSKGGDIMDERLRSYLESRGLKKDATDEEAWAYLEEIERMDLKRPEKDPGPPARTTEGPPAAAPSPEAQPDPDEVRQEVIRESREIIAMYARFGFQEDGERMVREGKTLDEARQWLVDNLAKKREKEPTIRSTPGQDERDKFRLATVDSILLRGGMEMETPAAGAEELRGFTLRELAREALRIAGRPLGGDPMDMIGRALTTSDFPYILADSARKSLFAGFDTAPESWMTWCGIGQVSDFKTHSSVRASETDALEEVAEHGDYKYGDRTEAREQYSIATYGKLFAITRQAIINDDLNALTDIPRSHGESAARKIGDVAYAVLTANAAMGDGTALFHADHSNLGTGGVVSETTIGEAIKLMKLQKDLRSLRRLNIRPFFFLGPVAIEGSTTIFFASSMLGTQAKPNLVNPYADPYFTRVYDARLDSDSATIWYLAGPKNKTVTVFFLNGIQRPYMETKQGWTVDGVEYKVRIDAGAKAMDWRGLVKNAGA